jgi:hypothetical protein
LAQYITMYRAGKDERSARRSHPTLERTAAGFVGTRGRARLGTEARKTAELTPLGRRLLGLDLWDES